MKKRKRMSLQDKAMEAMTKAVQQVIAQHKKTGRPLAIWKNGKVAWVSPYTLK